MVVFPDPEGAENINALPVAIKNIFNSYIDNNRLVIQIY
jgi:hypothetical protein